MSLNTRLAALVCPLEGSAGDSEVEVKISRQTWPFPALPAGRSPPWLCDSLSMSPILVTFPPSLACGRESCLSPPKQLLLHFHLAHCMTLLSVSDGPCSTKMGPSSTWQATAMVRPRLGWDEVRLLVSPSQDWRAVWPWRGPVFPSVKHDQGWFLIQRL